MITGIYIGIWIADYACWFLSGHQRYKHLRYLTPCVGGFMAIYDRIYKIN